jgi:hypothetical protein
MDFVKIPATLKVEAKKALFIKESKARLHGINAKENLLEILIVIMNMAEEFFLSKKYKKYGKEKRECVITVIRDLCGSAFDDATISRMIETLVHTKNIKRIGLFKKITLWCKKKLSTK